MKWTPVMEANLRRHWWSGMTIPRIAEHFGVTPKAVESKRRFMGLPVRPRHQHSSKPAIAPRAARNWTALKDACLELAAQGRSHGDIATEIKVARSTICKWLGIQEYGGADKKFDPMTMRYDQYQTAWIAAAGPINTPLFRNIRCSDFGRPPMVETIVERHG